MKAQKRLRFLFYFCLVYRFLIALSFLLAFFLDLRLPVVFVSHFVTHHLQSEKKQNEDQSLNCHCHHDYPMIISTPYLLSLREPLKFLQGQS